MERTREIAFRALLVWLLLIALEVVQGFLRVFLIAPFVGQFRARQLGVLTGSVFILLVAWLCVRWIGARGAAPLVGVGIIWLVPTLIFELGFGHYLFGRSWRDLGADYDLFRGGLLALGMLVLTLAPLIAARLRGIHEVEDPARFE